MLEGTNVFLNAPTCRLIFNELINSELCKSKFGHTYSFIGFFFFFLTIVYIVKQYKTEDIYDTEDETMIHHMEHIWNYVVKKQCLTK